MLLSAHALSCRLEAAEGFACSGFAMARRRLFPESGSEAIRVAGADVVFDGPDSPITKTFACLPLGFNTLVDCRSEFVTRDAVFWV
jgi:hypothetical protein